MVKRFNFEKIGCQKYLVKIDSCIWAKHIHRELRPKDATCPFALVIMTSIKKHIGDTAEEASSEYLEEGTETEIKPFHRTLSCNADSLEAAYACSVQT